MTESVGPVRSEAGNASANSEMQVRVALKIHEKVGETNFKLLKLSVAWRVRSGQLHALQT